MSVPQPQSRQPKGAYVIWTSLAVLTVTLMAAGLAKYTLAAGEYWVYTVGAHQMFDGNRVYIPAGDPEMITAPFTYPPFFAFAFIPLLPFPWIVQKVLWFAISAGALTVVLLVVRRAVVPRAERDASRPVCPEWVFWVVLGVMVGRFVVAGFEMQSHDILIVLLSALCLQAWSQNQDARAGLFAGLAAACKATPLLFAPVFLWQRRFRALACLSLTLVAATLLPDVVTPAKDGSPWVATWYNTFVRGVRPGATAEAPGAWTRWNELNQGLAGTLQRLSSPPGPDSTPGVCDIHLWEPSPRVLKGITTAMQLGVLALLGAALWLPRHTLTPDQQRFVRFGQGGVVLCAMLLLSPMSSKPHFAALILPLSVCVGEFLYRRRDPVLVAGFIVLTFVSSLTVKGIWGTYVGNVFLSYGSVCWSTLLCMFLTTRVVRRCGILQPATTDQIALPPPLPPRRPCFLSRDPAAKRSV